MKRHSAAAQSISPTVYTATSSCDAQFPEFPDRDRRRRPGAFGINARFDRMLARVNVAASHAAPSPAEHRAKRRRTASSTSGSSERLPRTPVDAYAAFDGGRPGEGFRVLKPGDGALNGRWDDARVDVSGF